MKKLKLFWREKKEFFMLASMVGILAGFILLWVSWVGAVVVAVAFNVFCAYITLNVRVVADL
jgi:hypothetical protein